ncbi:MAG: hypothetical protein ISS41_11365 [Candidatus Aminicenantes bacterium]|nr:hypothetical protein [Candidatus Aminicenantes bacterium]
MGTPKKKYESQKELIPPAIAKKIRLLEAGKKMGQELKIDMLPNVFEEVRSVILPLVPWLDKPIFPEASFVDCPVPKAFKRKRGVRLFESSIIDIWLERSGKWFLRFCGSHRSEATFQEVDSHRLAEIMLQKLDDFLERSSGDAGIMEGAPFTKDIVLYNMMFMRFVSQCFESVKTLVKAREERLRIMGEWLNLLYEFSQSLDPLIGQGREVLIKGYSIFEDHARGTGRCTDDYLCSEALESFWEVLKNRNSVRSGSKYRESIAEYRIESLGDFLRRLNWIFDEVKKTGEDADANSLFGHNTGRLPFTEKEMVVLRELVNAIKSH